MARDFRAGRLSLIFESMRPFRLPPLALLLPLALLAGCSKAVPERKTASPQATAKTFYAAMLAGDVKTAQAAVVDDGDQQQRIENLAPEVGAVSNLNKAVEEKFGQSIEVPGGPLKKYGVQPSAIDNAKMTLNGDTATLSVEGAGTLNFKLVGDRWKIDLGDKGDGDQAVPMLKAITAAANAVAAEVKAGKYQSVDAVKAALGTKILTDTQEKAAGDAAKG